MDKFQPEFNHDYEAQPQADIRRALELLLHTKEVWERGNVRFVAAQLLYLCVQAGSEAPLNSKPYEALAEILKSSGETFEDTILSVASASESTESDFHESLWNIIEIDDVSQAPLIANAINLAYTIKAWEIAGAIHSTAISMSQLGEAELEGWEDVIKHMNIFFDVMAYDQRPEEESPEEAQLTHSFDQPSEEPIPDKLTNIIDFINSIPEGDDDFSSFISD